MSDSVNNTNNEESVEKIENKPTEEVKSTVTQEQQTVEATVSEQVQDDHSEKEVVEKKNSEPAQQEGAKVSTESSTQQFDAQKVVEKAKGLFATKRKEVIAALVTVAVIIVAFIGYNVIQSQPQSLINDVKVEFSGYEGSGTVTYNSQDIAEKVAELSYQKAGFNKEQAAGLAKRDSITYAQVSGDTKLASKLVQAEAMINSVRYEFDKTNGLKNGDEVTFAVTTNSKNSPFKVEKKTFKVKNLKKYEKVSASDLLKETPVTFSGFNGYGTISIAENDDDETYFEFENGKRPTNLKNGDKVTLEVSSDYIDTLKSSGKMVDSKTVEVTVEGLKELKDVKNFADLLKKNEDYSKSEHKNDSFNTYVLESQGSYLKVIPGEDKTSTGKIALITVYKVTHTGIGGSTDVRYKYFGYEAYLLKDGNLDLETAEKISSWGTEDYEGLKAELATDGYKEYSEKSN